MLYKFFVRPFLFLIDPETIHDFTREFFKFICGLPFVPKLLWWYYKVPDPKGQLWQTILGIDFPNPVGLAAGFIKHGDVHRQLVYMLGFGFVEVGTVVKEPQKGNAKPRLFRLPLDKALINRMGFNSPGVHAVKKEMQKNGPRIIVGGNIGKNTITPNAESAREHGDLVVKLDLYVDFWVINISSPNSPGLRDLQTNIPLLQEIIADVQKSNQQSGRPKPVFLKLAPDLTRAQLDLLLEKIEVDGYVLCNTTNQRNSQFLNSSDELVNQKGGLSGKPVRIRAINIVAYVHRKTGGKKPIIGVGGIFTAGDAWNMLCAGAWLIEGYTGFIYEGPGYAKRIKKGLLKWLNGRHISEVRGIRANYWRAIDIEAPATAEA